MRKVLCSECYKKLDLKELKEYSIQWQYSGDMYCNKHKPLIRADNFDDCNCPHFGETI